MKPSLSWLRNAAGSFLLAAAVAASAAEATPLPKGPGQFILPNLGEPVTVFTYKPPTYADGPLIVVIHGSERNAEEYRNSAITVAERCNAIIVAPLFDRERFSDERYKRGGGVTKDGRLQPRDQWTFNVIVRLVAAVREREGKPGMPYYLLGHSGGAQVVSKMAMFMPGDAQRFVAANPGSNVFPDRKIPFPYGLGGLPDELGNDEVLRQYCAAPLTLYLGTGDVYQNASDGFDFSENAMRQGPVRLARNHNFFSVMQKLAAERGWKFNWRIVETPGIGHSGSKMFHASEVEDALFGPGRRTDCRH
ncbi:MAG: alpha/beta hydrolase family protein [Verrucomicrobia bacterium]|nr:alpha/beta hydrolase family protein [Verrucomicrobiota bacterium]